MWFYHIEGHIAIMRRYCAACAPPKQHSQNACHTGCFYNINLIRRALFGHVDDNPNEVAYLESGTGGPEEFATHMEDSQYLYGLRESVCVCVYVCVCVFMIIIL